jgi:hypothetical protein
LGRREPPAGPFTGAVYSSTINELQNARFGANLQFGTSAVNCTDPQHAAPSYRIDLAWLAEGALLRLLGCTIEL